MSRAATLAIIALLAVIAWGTIQPDPVTVVDGGSITVTTLPDYCATTDVYYVNCHP